MSLLDGMFDLGVATCETDHEHCVGNLFPEERESIAQAVPVRRREFAAGRHCARAAMRKLGVPTLPIPMGADRSPRWPSQVVGSISHCRTRCVAVAALKSQGFLSLGVDIEEAVDLDDDLYETICAPEELAAIRLLPHHRRGLAATSIFSAKECIFKCQYPLTGQMFDFHDMRIDLDLGFRRFHCRFAIDTFAFKAGESVSGQIRQAQGYIVTGVSLKSSRRHYGPDYA